MAVMILLAAAHLGFWTWGAVLGVRDGTLGLVNVAALAAWLAAIGLWLVVVAWLSRSGWLTGPGVVTLPALWVPAPPVMLSLFGLMVVPALADALVRAPEALPAFLVPALNGLRILAIGSILKAWRGELPRRIGYGVGIPDFFFGLWSLGSAIGGGFEHEGVAWVWNLTGAAILVMMVPMVYTVLRPQRLHAAGKADGSSILAYPLVLAPAGLASMFLILHGIALYAARIL